MPISEFERLVEDGFKCLPEWVRQRIKNVGLEDGETLLGYYHGTPLSARGENYGVGMTLPDTITLYRHPIEEAAREDKMDVREVISETIWHEFAHHFGMNEGEVRDRERQRKGS